MLIALGQRDESGFADCVTLHPEGSKCHFYLKNSSNEFVQSETDAVMLTRNED